MAERAFKILSNFRGKTVGKLNDREQREEKKDKPLHSFLIVSQIKMIAK